MTEQNDSHNALLRPEQLSALWGIGERQVRKLLGELETLGFKVEAAERGVRLVSPGLAEAVRVCRSQKKELSTLLLDPAAARFLTPGGAADGLDPLAMLIYVSAELALLREVVGTAAGAMQTGAALAPLAPGFSFTNKGLPDPRRAL